jgi:hypothetical protein
VGFASQGKHLADLFRGNPGRSPGAGHIGQTVFEAQVLQADSLDTQSALAPESDRVHINPRLAGNLGIVEAIGDGQKNPGPQSHLLSPIMPSSQAFQSLSLVGGQGYHRRCWSTHVGLADTSQLVGG